MTMTPSNRIISHALMLATLLGLATPALAEEVVSVHVLDTRTIAITEAFPELAAGAGYTFRARKLLLAPGARTEILVKAGAPSITYVTRGEVVERRDQGPATRRARHEATLDRGDVVHYWENVGSEPAELLIVDVHPDARP
jgi:quercetin dioxygenase-like cupin family protein